MKTLQLINKTLQEEIRDEILSVNYHLSQAMLNQNVPDILRYRKSLNTLISIILKNNDDNGI